ncbi:MAG: fibronectin type III domain-containing protein, partial [Chloroflexi bacterium]|nr:fibronectin type III domain-containing protein [Chloroflexota bacterium]
MRLAWLKARLSGKSPLLSNGVTKFRQAFFKGFSLITLALFIFAGTVLLDFHLETASTLSAQSIEIPSQADWTDQGVVISPGPPGSWDVRLTGAVSPCAVIKLDGTYFLYYIGADGNRADDGDARHRALGVATSSDGISYSKYSGNPIITHLPTNDEEEGIFTCGATLDEGGDVILYYGAMTSFAPSAVNDDAWVAISSDGFDFTDLPGNPVIDHDDSSVWGWGDELDPLGVFEHNGAWHVYYSVGNGLDFSGNALVWELGLASGPAPNDLPNTGPALTGGDDIRGGADPVWLNEDEIALFIVRRDGSGQFYIEARVVDSDAPDELSAPVETYNFSDSTHATVYLDEQAGKWFMYYLTASGEIKVKTASLPGGSEEDTTPPSAPFDLSADPVSHSRIDLSWSAASDPESGVSSYTIYRDGANIGSSTDTSFSDTGLTQSTTYSYEVSANNGAGLEGPESSAVTATTPDEPTDPPGDTGVWPDATTWPTATPESQGMSSAMLANAPNNATTPIGTAIVIRNGYDVWHYGDPYADDLGWWASVMRSYMTTIYGMLIQRGVIPGGQAAVEMQVNDLPSQTAQGFGDNVKLKHLLSYTSCASPPGSGWSYGCNYPKIEDIFTEITGSPPWEYINDELRPILEGKSWQAIQVTHDDDNLRVVGPQADMARWGYLMLRNGSWNGEQVLDPWFVEMATSPLLKADGSGFADDNEGWQIHTNGGGIWPGLPLDSYAALGGLSQSVIFVAPSLDLVVARIGQSPGETDPIEKFLKPIIDAVIDGDPPPPDEAPPPENSDSLIANLTVASGKSYQIVENGLSSGETLYIDRPYTFTSVPQALQGAAYIRTANDDKSRTEADFLSFTLAQDARVYVAYDTRASQLPQWLSDWTDSGEILGTTDIVDRLVFFKDFAAGEVVLGGNLAAGAAGPESKYTVAATPTDGGDPPPPPPSDDGDSGPIISNLIVASGRSYEIVDNGLSSAEAVYIDRFYTFTEIPQALQGAAYIRTANDDKARTEADFISFTLAQDARVYVAYDTRASQLPQWLWDWTDSGEILGTTDIVDRLVFFKD